MITEVTQSKVCKKYTKNGNPVILESEEKYAKDNYKKGKH